MRVGKYRAYSSTANLGPGFDVLGIALQAFYDEAEVRVSMNGEGKVKVRYIGPYSNQVSSFAGDCVAKRAALALLRRYRSDVDVNMVIWKGVPPGKGLGSSGASAALVVHALDDILDLGLKDEEKVLLAGEGEVASAGTPHYDNVAASLLGGLAIVSKSKAGIKVWSTKVSATFVVAVPDVRTHHSKTKLMRSLIPDEVPLNVHVENSSYLATLLAGLLTGDLKLAGYGMSNDAIVTKARSPHVPCYAEAMEAAIKAGAYGFTLSGAGPSTIALVDECSAETVAKALKKAYSSCGVKAQVVITQVAGRPERLD